MGRFDFIRFNGFAKGSLVGLLLNDLQNFDIFNERDMHAAAYYYIRDYFRKHERGNVYVRCEPHLAGMKPDIVVYEREKPIYVLELKFFIKPDRVNEVAINKDLDKLDEVLTKFSSVRWGFFQMIYDADELFTLSNPQLRRDRYHKISVHTINARRSDNDRRRNGYDSWREEWDWLREAHRDPV